MIFAFLVANDGSVIVAGRLVYTFLVSLWTDHIVWNKRHVFRSEMLKEIERPVVMQSAFSPKRPVL